MRWWNTDRLCVPTTHLQNLATMGVGNKAIDTSKEKNRRLTLGGTDVATYSQKVCQNLVWMVSRFGI